VDFLAEGTAVRNSIDVQTTVKRLDEMGICVHCLALGWGWIWRRRQNAVWVQSRVKGLRRKTQRERWITPDGQTKKNQ